MFPVLYLTLLGFSGLFPSSRPGNSAPKHRIAVVIPAHDERLLISDTVRGVLAQHYPPALFNVLVVADNCQDDTAELARTAGARVLERDTEPGKGQALETAFRLLLREDWEAFLIIDADTQLHPQCLAAISAELDRGAQAMQVFYGVLNPTASVRTAAMELALASFNGLRPKGKANLGLSCGLFGNGFCLTRNALAKVPHQARSIVEDLEYHLRLLAAGIRVKFLDRVWVKAEMPVTAQQARSQRVRWERGRLDLIRRYTPKLLNGLIRGRPGALEGLADVLMPPVGTLGLIALIPLSLGSPLAKALALSAIFLLFLHYLLASIRFGYLGRMARILVFIPWYFFWKAYVLGASIFKQRRLKWIRTSRSQENKSR